MALVLHDELSVWDIGFRWAGLDPDGLWLRYPLAVKDNFRLLMSAILDAEIICPTLCLDKRPPDSNADANYYIRTHLDDVEACIFGHRYSRKLLKWATLQRMDFREWCSRRDIPFPEFWFPAGWKLEFDCPEYGPPGMHMHHAEPENENTLVNFTFSFPRDENPESELDDLDKCDEDNDEEMLAGTGEHSGPNSPGPKSPDESLGQDASDTPKLRQDQRAKIACQVVALNIWESAPNTRIVAMKKHPAILNFAGARDYNVKVVHRWLSEVAPPHLKNPGRPRKKNSTDDE